MVVSGGGCPARPCVSSDSTFKLHGPTDSRVNGYSALPKTSSANRCTFSDRKTAAFCRPNAASFTDLSGWDRANRCCTVRVVHIYFYSGLSAHHFEQCGRYYDNSAYEMLEIDLRGCTTSTS